MERIFQVKRMVFVVGNLFKVDDLGVLLFQETTICGD